MDVRHAEVEHDGVVVALVELLQGFAPIHDGLDVVALAPAV